MRRSPQALLVFYGCRGSSHYFLYLCTLWLGVLCVKSSNIETGKILLYLQSIAGLVFRYLKAKKIVNRVQSFRIRR